MSTSGTEFINNSWLSKKKILFLGGGLDHEKLEVPGWKVGSGACLQQQQSKDDGAADFKEDDSSAGLLRSGAGQKRALTASCSFPTPPPSLFPVNVV